jgi:hypothetical protein
MRFVSILRGGAMQNQEDEMGEAHGWMDAASSVRVSQGNTEHVARARAESLPSERGEVTSHGATCLGLQFSTSTRTTTTTQGL